MEVLLRVKVGVGASSGEKFPAVSLLDWYELQEEVVIVMERPVPCDTLFNHIYNNAGPLEEEFAKEMMKQLVDASLNMLSNGVFHCDIKAENLLIETSSNGLRLRILDFGCSCIMQDEPYTHFCGTKMFSPPEVLIHKKYEAAPTTVWQLDVLLYEMLHAKQAFTTSKFLLGSISFSSELSPDCRNFLDLCLTASPKEHRTLEQIQLHPWLQNSGATPPD
ncbi:serine/threonine-protein kinase pim-2-like [Archocentrus centrarchus]|uniref:serine/threonine-protein kinase pim-2-like n=1 Tax=Archocentrus centrarchus TaxID=63155 RepID=UPI0011EA2108|nr:serine/threonine-protein kinase pim-2-like [Archocentrus centrarchus]